MIPVEQPAPDFDVYVVRPDTRWVKHEDNEPLEALYAAGFLPYSGTKGLRGVFYSARSARIVLPEFVFSSENRRIAKKFDERFQKSRVAADAFPFDEAFYRFCLEYFSVRHGKSVMPRERLRTIVESGLLSHVIVYGEIGRPVAYVLEVAAHNMRHYWYSFYDLAYVKQSLGLWLMLDCIRDAKEAKMGYYYLGTVYGAKALYKTNFAPLEWWSETVWSRDKKTLKELARKDVHRQFPSAEKSV